MKRILEPELMEGLEQAKAYLRQILARQTPHSCAFSPLLSLNLTDQRVSLTMAGSTVKPYCRPLTSETGS